MNAIISLSLLIIFISGCNLFSNENSDPEFEMIDIVVSEPELVNFKLDKPWENLFMGYINVIQIDSTWHLWYETFNEDSKKYDNPSLNTFISYATSVDGINWVKPSLNIHNYEELDNNILFYNNGKENGSIHGPTVFYDRKAALDRPFKMVYSRSNPEGDGAWLYGMVSKDGIYWEEERVILKKHADSQNVIFMVNGLYHLFFRYMEEVNGEDYRKIGYATSTVFGNNFQIRSLNLFDDKVYNETHFYTNSARSISENLILLFPSIFDTEENQMKIFIAQSAIDNYSSYNIIDTTAFRSLENLYQQLTVAPQNVYNDSILWIYMSLNPNPHDGWRNVTDKYQGEIVRVGIKVSRNK